ncbi:hypothetical protein [Maribacter sp.]|uniref:hypothetical protein n=1 Tax=Maribacter sp. TaxID=1897614 RepID=UPI003299FA24
MNLKIILKKIAWLVLYLLFNAVLFFIEVSILFEGGDSSYSSNSGLNSIDDILEAFSAIFNVLEGVVMVFYFYWSIGMVIIGLLLFIPVQVYYINRKYKHHRKKFWFSLLASFVVVIGLKLLMYSWMYIDMNYL